MKVFVDAALLIGADAVRLFIFPPRQTEQVGETVYHLDANGQRLGTLGMPGGLATHLFDASHFQLDDPNCMAHQNFWKAETPFIKNVADVRRMIVPDKTY